MTEDLTVHLRDDFDLELGVVVSVSSKTRIFMIIFFYIFKNDASTSIGYTCVPKKIFYWKIQVSAVYILNKDLFKGVGLPSSLYIPLSAGVETSMSKAASMACSCLLCSGEPPYV